MMPDSDNPADAVERGHVAQARLVVGQSRQEIDVQHDGDASQRTCLQPVSIFGKPVSSPPCRKSMLAPSIAVVSPGISPNTE